MSDLKRLSRRQVAREEIETSIDLIVEEGSPVSAHLLAWAAIDVLRGVAMNRGEETFLERLETIIRDEKIKVWRSVLRSHYTFAKHADRDPEREVEDFNPESTHLTLLAAITDYGTIYKQLTLPMYLFRGWMFVRNPHMLVEGAFEEVVPGGERIFGAGAPASVLQSLYREFKKNERWYLANVPAERLPNIEL